VSSVVPSETAVQAQVMLGENLSVCMLRIKSQVCALSASAATGKSS